MNALSDHLLPRLNNCASVYGKPLQKHNVFIQLQFISIDFKDAGIYSCMASSNGNKMVISKMNVCIKCK